MSKLELYNLNFLVPVVLLSCTENPPKRSAGSAEGRSSATGQPLRHGPDQRLRRERGLSLAAADAQDGGQTQTGQRFRGLLQDIRAGKLKKIFLVDLKKKKKKSS